MKQQVNLYQFVTQPPRAPLPFNYLLALNVFLISLLMFLFLTSGLHLFLQKHEIKSLQAQSLAAKQELIATKAKFPTIDIPTQIVDKSKLARCETNFSTILEILSKDIPNTVWLTEFTIRENAGLITLKGKAVTLQDVYKFESSLKSEPLFSKHTFILENVTTPVVATTEATPTVAQPSYLNFSLTITAPKKNV